MKSPEIELDFSPEFLLDFLHSKGWTTVKVLENSTTLMSGPDLDQNRLYVVVPKYIGKDWPYTAKSIIHTVADSESCEPNSIILELRSRLESNGKDHTAAIKLKFGDKYKDSISLAETEFVSKFLRLTLYHSIIDGRESYRLPSEAKSLVKNFKVSQSLQGSFIFVVKSPEPNLQRSFIESSDFLSVSDSAIFRLVNGLDILFKYPDFADDFRRVLKHSQEGISAGIAANLSTLFKSVNTSERRVVFNIPSNFLSSSPDLNLNFKISDREIAHLQKIRDILSETRQEFIELKVKIVALRSHDPLKQTMLHKTSALILDSDDGFLNKRKISLDLNKSQYDRAIEAYKNGEVLTINGLIEINDNRIYSNSITSMS
ncbi:hypothetical protein [Bdellovibrio sp.]|uniref:hypothetical protein n=1 Tax=Bdellovibrio sp. TaxID=28201 RepID=UPI003221904E